MPRPRIVRSISGGSENRHITRVLLLFVLKQVTPLPRGIPALATTIAFGVMPLTTDCNSPTTRRAPLRRT